MKKKQNFNSLEPRRTILLILVGIMFIAFLPIVNANDWDWDNVLDYENEDKTVVITDWLGLGGELGNATLVSHKIPTEIKGVIQGKDRAVMYYEFDFENEYLGGLGNVKFINMKNGELIEKNYYFAQAIYENIEIADEVKQTCEIDKDNKEICSYEILTFKTEKHLAKWVKLNTTNIPAGKITIGLITDVNENDYIDGQWKIAGKYVKKHASWTDSLSTGLIDYYDFDETSGTNVIEKVFGKNNGTNTGATIKTQGLINASYNFTKSESDKIDFSYQPFSGNNNWSASFWFRTPLAGGDQERQILVWGTAGADASVQIALENGDPHEIMFSDGSQTCLSVYGVDDNSWKHGVFTYATGGTIAKGYINATNVCNVSMGTTNVGSGNLGIGYRPSDSSGFFNGTIDEIGIWNRTLTDSEVSDLYNGGTGITYKPLPRVTLNSPADTSITTRTNVLFNCSAEAIGGNTISNISLFTNQTGSWGQRNITTGLSQITSTVTFNQTFIADQKVTWNCLATDNQKNSQYASSNFTFTIDTTPPTNVLNAPRGTLNFGQVGSEEYINWTIGGNPNACWIEYNGVNTTKTCTDNNATFILRNNIYNITMWTNDSENNFVKNTSNWLYYIVQINETFDNETLEGDTEDFIVHVKSNSILDNTYLWYNSTINYATLQNIGGLVYRISKTLTTPITAQDINKTFWWDFDLSGGQNINSSLNNQSVKNLQIGDCSSFSNALINYTLFDEETPNVKLINTTIELDLIVKALDYKTIISTYNVTLNQTSSVCVSLNLGDSKYYLDSTVKYYNNSLGAGYSIETHNIRKRLTNQTNIPINVSLYDLPTAVATKFIIKLKGENFLPLPNALIDITRYYVGEGLFRTIELPITDSSGQAIASLRKDDTTYTIQVSDRDSLLATFDNIIPICQNELTEECIINLNIFGSTKHLEDYYTNDGVEFSLDYDDTTRDITSIFTTRTGEPHNITLKAVLFNRFENQTVCIDSLISSSGTLICSVPLTYDNSTVIVTLTKNSVTNVLAQTMINLYPNPSSFFGNDRIILILVLMLTIPLMFISSLTGLVIGGILGLIVATLLLLSTGGSGLGITTSVIWLIASGVVIIWKLTRGGNSD